MLLRSCATVAALLLLLTACGSEAATDGEGGGATTSGNSTGDRVPLEHRAVAMACSDERPPGAGGFGDPTDKCATDGECTDGANGRCVATLGGPAFCSYDECSADADCGSARVCACRNPASYNANICMNGACRLDADCGAGGYCSPSAVTVYSSCLTGIEVGSVGYFCHQPEDECVDDADCGEMGSVCLFRVEPMRWVCHDLVCTK